MVASCKYQIHVNRSINVVITHGYLELYAIHLIDSSSDMHLCLGCHCLLSLYWKLAAAEIGHPGSHRHKAYKLWTCERDSLGINITRFTSLFGLRILQYTYI
jgi:hypothetical protein